MSDVDWNSVIKVVERLNENIGRLNQEFLILNNRVNDLEVALENLRAQYKTHGHPYKPEPRYA